MTTESIYHQKLYCHSTPNSSCTEWFLCMVRNLWINYLSAIGCLSLESPELSCYSDAQNHCPFHQMSCNRELGSYYPIKMQGWYCHWHSVIRIPNTWYYWSQTNSWHKADRWLNFPGLRSFGFLHFLHMTLSVCSCVRACVCVCVRERQREWGGEEMQVAVFKGIIVFHRIPSEIEGLDFKQHVSY